MFPYPADGHLIPYRLQRILCTLITAKQKVVESRLGAGNEPQWDTDECKRVTKRVRKPQHTHTIDTHKRWWRATNSCRKKKSIWIIIAALLPGWSSRQDKTVSSSSSKEEEIDGRVTLRVAWVVVSCRRRLDGGITGSSESALFIPSLTRRRLAPSHRTNGRQQKLTGSN